MTYDEIAKLTEQLPYRDKLRLVQLLIQRGRKEEEQYLEQRKQGGKVDKEMVQYIAERLAKLKPAKRKTVLSCIAAMFQFQGGISPEEQKRLLAELEKAKFISIDANNRTFYHKA
ncbi:MAG: hypothetical protein K1X53_01160 [Candidatus Sumerlaeaceae bacterium]|nr:hypothetical protein [Candidatus Sumerlaeaceae bacterium]